LSDGDRRVAATDGRRRRFLLASIVVVATCGMIYELVVGTIAGFFLGNAVTEFALVLGVYLSAMGVGSSLSARLHTRVTARFVEVETLVALLGGSSAALLFAAFVRGGSVAWFRALLYGDVFAIGALIGVELPLLMRLLKDDLGSNETIAQSLTFDYVGSLLASLLFPLLFMPWLGLVRTAALSGAVNAAVACAGTRLLAPGGGRRLRQVGSAVVLVGLVTIAIYGGAIARATAD
jgi:spermidine synthase